MALKLKDLQNRVYSGRECVRFEVLVPVGDNEFVLAQFAKQTYCTWNMRIVLNRTRDKDSEVYNFGYVMPKDNVPLELIAATGLKYFQLYLKEEIQKKTEIDFTLGTMLEGM